MKIILSALLTFVVFFGSSGASADSMQFRFGFGASSYYASKLIDPETSFHQIVPELFGYRNIQLNEQVILRPGVRMSYSWTNSDLGAPQAFTIRESDLKTGGELNLLWKRFPLLIPCFTLGGGLIYRQTQLSVSPPLLGTSNDPIASSALYPFFQGQLSMRLPLNNDLFEIAPYARYTSILHDPRTQWGFGIEASMACL